MIKLNILVATLVGAVAIGAGPALAGPGTSGGLVIADFSGDGLDDILFRNQTDTGAGAPNGFVGFWYLNGGGNPIILDGFGVPDPGPNFEIVGAGYLDTDAFADILWRDTSTGDLTVWFMGNKVITGSLALGQPGGGLVAVAVGDIDNANNDDIVFRGSNTVAAWLLDGSANVQAGFSIGTISNNWKIIALGDVDRDSKADLVFRNATDGFVGFWTLDGAAATVITGGAGVPDPGSGFQIRGFGDLNGDTSADVVWAQLSDESIISWNMAPDLSIGSSTAYGFSTGLAMAAIGDVTGSGNADILFSGGGSVAQWLLDATGAVSSGASVGTISANWVIENNATAN
ncbi:MAG: hypothetical protein GWP08_21730 [Nitrospiraceae bacterium]|nr:hypothetical protein [Nitrospiraceae bacterium]